MLTSKTKKAICLIVVVLLVLWAACKTQDVKLPPALQGLFTAKDSLPMSVSFIHENDGFYNVQVEYPQFCKASSAFNEKIADLIAGKIETFKKDAKDNYEARRATALAESPLPEIPDRPFDFIGSWESSQINGEYVSFVVYLYYFTGGAHGVTEVHAFNYNLKEGKEITILDFLNSSQPALEKLADLSSQSVTSQLGSGGLVIDGFLEQMIEDGTKPTQENYQNFNFNYNSLTIYFQQYQVAPGSAGPITSVFYKDTLDANSINSDYLK